MLPVLIQYWRELFSGISSPLDLSDKSKFKGKKNINFKGLITSLIAFSEQHFYAVLVLHLFCSFLVCYDRQKSCTRCFVFLLEHSFLTSAVPMHLTIFFWVKKKKKCLWNLAEKQIQILIIIIIKSQPNKRIKPVIDASPPAQFEGAKTKVAAERERVACDVVEILVDQQQFAPSGTNNRVHHLQSPSSSFFLPQFWRWLWSPAGQLNVVPI